MRVLWLAPWLLLSLPIMAGQASAQQTVEVAGQLGYGVMHAGGQSVDVTRAAPVYADLSLRLWNPEQPHLVVGASLRAELQGAGAIGGMPRVELRTRYGPLEVRPGAGFVAMFTPRSLLGPEGGVTALWVFPERFCIIASAAVTAYLVGSDLPRRSTLIVLHGGLGALLRY